MVEGTTPLPIGREIAVQDILLEYRAYFAFENSVEPGYVTEKIMNAYLGGAVPVYYGAPDVQDHVPPGSFIDANPGADEGAAPLSQLLALRRQVRQVLEDEEAWRSYHAWRSKAVETWDGGEFSRRTRWTEGTTVCRMCRYVFAKKHGLAFDHDTQLIRGK